MYRKKSKRSLPGKLAGVAVLGFVLWTVGAAAQYLPQHLSCSAEQAPFLQEGTAPPNDATFFPYLLTSPFCTPVSGKVTSPFGWREHPITHEENFHRGIDIAAQEGTMIRAALPGTVEQTGFDELRGNFVVLRHSEDLLTCYQHCSKLLCQEGENLSKGDTIALVGSTGAATGPHLHFEVEVEGLDVDPAWRLPVQEMGS